MIGIPPDQLDKDLRVLFLCGLPGGYPDDLIDVDLDALEGEGVIRVTNADYLARPLRLTPTEATAIIVALRALRGGADADTRDVVDRALAKLEEAAAGGPAAWSTPATPPPQTSPLRARLDDAVRQERQVRLTYYVPARDEESDRVVDPHAVVRHHGVDYLDAWCHSAGAPRLFRLDRIHDADRARIGGHHRRRRRRATSPAASSAAVTTPRWSRWRCAPAPAGSRSTTRTRRCDPAADGGSQVDLLSATSSWLRRLLLRLAPYARGGLTGALRPRRRRLGHAALWLCTTSPRARLSCLFLCLTSGPSMLLPLIGSLGTPELLIILAIVILLFGASKLPELARGSGRALRIFKAET